MQKIKVSILAPNSNVKIHGEASVDINQLADLITKETWSPALYKNAYRNMENAYHSDLFAIDVDRGCTLEQAKDIFKDHWHIIGTSRNHQKEKTLKSGKKLPACDRFRVILLLDKPMESDIECKKTFKYLQDKYGFLDDACKDISRLFYPCTSIVSVNYDILGAVRDCSGDPDPNAADVGKVKIDRPLGTNLKGILYGESMDFFMRGAEPGTRHNRLFKAASDAKEQGYSIEEVRELLEQCGDRNHIDTFFPIAPEHENTINQVFNRPSTNPIRLEKAGLALEDKKIISLGDLLGKTREYLNDKDAIRGDSTGITGLDDLLGGGFRLGEVTVLQGEAKTGKNTLYHQIQFYMLQRGVAQGYASRELDPIEEVAPNYISLLSGRNAWLDEINDADYKTYESTLASYPLFFMPGYGPTQWEEIEEWMNIMLGSGVKHFWFDHLHYMLDDEDYKQASKLMRNIKTFAKSKKVHINLIVQPTKIGRDERIGLNSLKGGAAVGQALDNLLLFSRGQPEDSIQDISNCSVLELSHARHKIAKRGKIYLQYDPKTTRYTELKGIDTAPKPPDPRVPAYNNFENSLKSGVKNKWQVN